MKNNRPLEISTWALIGISALGVFSVSAMAFLDPQGVMDLVQVKLENNDAYSSIRGVYGGVGFSLLAVLGYLTWRDRTAAVAFIAMFWGMYALSRMMTIGMEGALGDFGSQWLAIESTLTIFALVILGLRLAAVRAGRLVYAR
jgi:hypothetical protein